MDTVHLSHPARRFSANDVAATLEPLLLSDPLQCPSATLVGVDGRKRRWKA